MGQPFVGKRVPELVRVNIRDACLFASFLYDLEDVAGTQRPLFAEPQSGV